MKRTHLLLSTAIVPLLLLTGCDERTADVSWLDALKVWITGQVPQELLMDDLSITAHDILGQEMIEKTPTGSYLSGRFAQSNFDWETASKYFNEVLESDPNSLDLQKRSMALAMGAGNYAFAFEQARKIVNVDNSNSLPKLFLAMQDFKNQDYEQVLLDVDKIPDDGISQFIKPLMKSWALAGEKKLDLSGLNKNVVHFYHAILIADYLNDQLALKNLSMRDYSHLDLSIKTIAHIASVFDKHGLSAQAKELLKNIPEGAVEAAEISDIRPITTPTEGMARALFDMASILYQDYPDSARLFAEMSHYLDSSQTDARALLGHMATEFRRYDEAIAIFNDIDAKDNPNLDIRLKRQIADLLEKSGKADQAIKALEDIVDTSKNIDAQVQIGDIYRAQENFKDALSAYNKAEEMLGGNVTAKNWNILYARGICNERLKNWDEAEKDLKSALALEPDQPYILNYLGYSWIDQGKNIDEATRMIEKAARLKPDDGYIVDSLGWAYYKQGRYPQASATLERAVSLSPQDSTINDHLGDAYWQVGRHNEARFQWQRALSFSDDNEQSTTLNKKIENGITENMIAPTATPNAAAQVNGDTSTAPE